MWLSFYSFKSNVWIQEIKRGGEFILHLIIWKRIKDFMLQNQIDIAFKLSLNYTRYLVDFSNTKIQKNLVQRKTNLLIYWPIGYFPKSETQVRSIYLSYSFYITK